MGRRGMCGFQLIAEIDWDGKLLYGATLDSWKLERDSWLFHLHVVYVRQ